MFGGRVTAAGAGFPSSDMGDQRHGLAIHFPDGTSIEVHPGMGAGPDGETEMNVDLSQVRIFVRPGVTDMRKQINGLAVIAEAVMNQRPFSGNLFLFCGRSRNVMKVLYWDRNGFCLWMKRLEKDRFP